MNLKIFALCCHTFALNMQLSVTNYSPISDLAGCPVAFYMVPYIWSAYPKHDETCPLANLITCPICPAQKNSCRVFKKIPLPTQKNVRDKYSYSIGTIAHYSATSRIVSTLIIFWKNPGNSCAYRHKPVGDQWTRNILRVGDQWARNISP